MSGSEPLREETESLKGRILARLTWPKLSLRQQVPALLVLVFGVAISAFLALSVRNWEKSWSANEFGLDADRCFQALQSSLSYEEELLCSMARLLADAGPGLCGKDASHFREFASHAAIQRPDLLGFSFYRTGSTEPCVYWTRPGSNERAAGATVDREATASGGHLRSSFDLGGLLSSGLGPVAEAGLEFVVRVPGENRADYRIKLRRGANGMNSEVVGADRFQARKELPHLVREVTFGSQTWTARVAATPGYLGQRTTHWAWLILAFGLLFTVLLADYILVISVRVDSVERMVHEHTTALSSAHGELAAQLTRGNDASVQLGKLTQALEFSPIAVVITDDAGVVEYVNRKFSEATEFKRDDVIGRPVSLLTEDTLSPEDRASLERAMREEREWHCEVRDVRKSGESMELDVFVAPVRDKVQDIEYFVFMLADITERKQLQEQFLQSQKMEVIGRLAGGVVHDLSNMLTVILGFSQMVQSQLEEDDPLMEEIEEIIRVGERASALNKQLLTFARTQSYDAEELDVNEALREMNRFLRRTIGEDVILTTRLTPNIGFIEIDHGQFNQMIMNLAVNSRDAMPQGGTLTLATEDVFLPAERAGIFGLTAGRYIRLEVADTGSGMSEEVRKHLFEPFFTTKAEGKGTGLGLSTVYGIASRFNGAIDVASELGKGTAFAIYFPVCVPAAPKAADTVVDAIPRGDETILVVEDDRDVRQLSVTLLESVGYTVHVAESGHEAVDIFSNSRHEIHLVLTDVVMPNMNGIELAGRLRKIRQDVRVIYTTGFSEHPILNRGMMFDHQLIRKPFTRAKLADAIREELDRSPAVAAGAVG